MNGGVDFGLPPAAQLLAKGLGKGEIHVWRAHAETQAELFNSGCLSAEELERAARLRLPSLREAFIFAHSLQRQVLSQYLDVAPADLMFGTEAQGKPVIVGRGLRFNLTHTGSAVLLVVSACLAVGIDLEDCARKLDVPALALACLDEADLHRFEGVPLEQRQACLLQWWTRKEAILKAQGCGLQRDPRELEVSWPGTPVARVSFQDQGRDWVVADLALGDRWRAAVSVEGQVHRLHGFCLGW
jgi:4'-phosphopantetheinyl transferase